MIEEKWKIVQFLSDFSKIQRYFVEKEIQRKTFLENHFSKIIFFRAFDELLSTPIQLISPSPSWLLISFKQIDKYLLWMKRVQNFSIIVNFNCMLQFSVKWMEKWPMQILSEICTFSSFQSSFLGVFFLSRQNSFFFSLFLFSALLSSFYETHLAI